jgi:hypothetical protein
MARRPDLTSAVSRFLALYIPARFGPHPRGETIVQLARQLRGFHPRSQARR